MTVWFLYRNEKPAGPYSRERIVELLSAGKIADEDYIWRKGLEDWITINNCDEFASAQRRVLPPPFRHEQKPKRGKAYRWLGKALGVLAFIAAFLVVKYWVMTPAIKGHVRQIITSTTLEDELKQTALEYSRNLPETLENGMKIIEVNAEGKNLYYVAELPRTEQTLTLQPKALAKYLCNDAGQWDWLNRGAIYNYRYQNSSGKHMGTITITKANC